MTWTAGVFSGGEAGIRTRGTLLHVQRLSKPPHSATLPPLRGWRPLSRIVLFYLDGWEKQDTRTANEALLCLPLGSPLHIMENVGMESPDNRLSG